MESESTKIKKLAKIIDIIARRCWRGLPALIGDAPQPSRDDLKEAFFFRPSPEVELDVRVQGGPLTDGREIEQENMMIDEVDAVLAVIPWNDLVLAVRWYRDEWPRRWAMYREYINAKTVPALSWGRDSVARAAEKFDVTEFILRQTARSVPFEIARAVSLGLTKDEALPRIEQ